MINMESLKLRILEQIFLFEYATLNKHDCPEIGVHCEWTVAASLRPVNGYEATVGSRCYGEGHL